ncbi:MAG TPA: PhnD/SsuA/transferrin family substrate-binding protein [Gammaproteobacteria bacterium]|nr:PhnD/SsuA/transferrin family substrate-binding protein [Xanthomonadales bacterium]HPI96977.1 PhnD/SsuA/transferrin family substrate-binding protein [Gammaproteobacteria bacterium]HPQ88328.1 PhnD/SsuA/transferrin family substrate-binding protein [Gammaproteobacteria bacterium]
MDSLKMMVCPHDTAGDPIKWFQFSQYLSKYANVSTLFYQCLDFVEFHNKMEEADIIYANPQDSLSLQEKHGFIPLLHSTNLFDEIVFIANQDADHGSLEVLNNQECVSCNSMMVTRIGIKDLFSKNIKPKTIHSKDNWMAVVKAVSQGEMPYGFVYKDFYDGLNKMSKSLVHKLGETQEQSIFHTLFINPKYADHKNHLIQTLSEAHLTEKGKSVLSGVNIEKFITVSKLEILRFRSLLTLGSEIME